MDAPEVRNFGESGVESFDAYYARWPSALGNVPRPVVQHWIYRHWQDFKRDWLKRGLRSFEFTLVELNNSEVMTIGHVRDWMQTLDYWGDELFRDIRRRETWLGRFMLQSGTSPAPIIIAPDALGLQHPTGAQMKPVQLIEGHMRLAYLRAMVRHGHRSLQPMHEVWKVKLPRESFRCANPAVEAP